MLGHMFTPDHDYRQGDRIYEQKNNKTITAIGMAAFMTAAGVLTAMAAQSPTIVAGSGMSQSGAAGRACRAPEAQGAGTIWGTIISVDNGSIDMECPSGNVFEGRSHREYFRRHPDSGWRERLSG